MIPVNPVTLRITPALAQGLAALKPEELRKAVATGLRKGLLEIHSLVTKERLTGKGPFPVEQNRLGVVTGHGRRSFYVAEVETSAQAITGALGVPVHYMVAHELGFEGTVTVREHRRTRKNRTWLVKSHRRQMLIPARAPVQTGAKEHLGRIETEITKALKEAMA